MLTALALLALGAALRALCQADKAVIEARCARESAALARNVAEQALCEVPARPEGSA